MSNMTRRAILAGIAASPTIALSAAALAPAEPVGEVQGLLDQFLAVQCQSLVADDAYQDCHFAAQKAFPKRPASLMGVPWWCSNRSANLRLDMKDINERYDALALAPDLSSEQKAKLEKRRRSSLRKLAKCEAREQAIIDASGYRALKAKADALDEEQDRLIDAIITSPSRTMGDVVAKLRLLGNWEPFAEIESRPEDMGVVERTYVALLADVERLAGKGRAA